MSRFPLLATAVCFLTASGCAPVTDPATSSAIEALAASPVVCTAGPDCDAKWSRASTWVAQNSDYKVQVASETLIQTMGPLPYDPRPAFVVTKMATGDNSFRIELNGGCDNIFGCIPGLKESRAKFVAFVNSGGVSAPAVIAHKGPAIGIQMVPVAANVASELKLDSARGLIIVNVVPGSLADKAGVLRNDVILSANSAVTNNVSDLGAAIEAAAKTHHLVLTIWRDGAEDDISIGL